MSTISTIIIRRGVAGAAGANGATGATGATGPAGSDATVTANAVTAVMDDNAASNRTALGLGTAATANLSSIIFSRSYAMVVTNTTTNYYTRVYYKAVEYGTGANDITVAHVISGGGSTASVAVVGRAITVTCGSTCTAETLIAAVNASSSASALVTASVIGPAGATLTAVSATALKSAVKHDDKGSLIVGSQNGTGSEEQNVTLYNGPGNLVIQDMAVFGALKPGATAEQIAAGTGWIFRMRPWLSHGGSVGARISETTWDLDGSLAIIPSHRTQYGNNSQGRDTAFWQFSSGQATSGDPIRRSRAQLMRSNWYTGGTEYRESIGWQSVPQVDGGNMSIRYYDQATVAGDSDGPAGSSTTTGDLGGRQIAEITYNGIWNRGIAPTFDALTPGASITQTCSIYRTIQNAKVTLSANGTLILAGLMDGMKGVIYVKQPASGGPYTLTPDGGSALDLSTTANYLDRVAWEFDGTTINFQTAKNVSQALAGLDSDASAFIAANGTSDITEKSAINTLVTGLKSASLWTKLIAFYPFVGSTAAAHKWNLKDPRDLDAAFRIAWTGTPTTSTANGVKGDGSSVHGNTFITLSNTGTLPSPNAVAGYACTRGTAMSTAAISYILGATDASGRFGIYTEASGASMSSTGPNSANSGLFGATGFIDHFLITRINSSTTYTGKGARYDGPSTNAVSGAPAQPIYILARNNSGAVGGRTDAALSATAFFNTSLSSTEWDALRGLVNAFNTTIGRAP